MSTTEERVDRLEMLMAELADAQLRTQASLKRLSEEQARSEKRLSEAQTRTEASLQKFSEDNRRAQARTEAELERRSIEMQAFRAEMQESRKEMNQKWGELAQRLGTVVEDIVAPNIPRVARELFGFSARTSWFVDRS